MTMKIGNWTNPYPTIRSLGRDGGFGDDRTATQHEARHIH